MNAELIAPNDTDARLDAMTDEELMREFVRCISVTVEGIRSAAAVVLRWESRGYDISGLQGGRLPQWVRLVAHNKLLPEIILMFSGQPSLINRFAGYPKSDQQKIVENEPIKVLTYAPNGELSDKMLPVAQVLEQPAIRKQVIARDHIRNEVEQSAWLSAATAEARRARVPDKIGELKIDKDNGGVWFKRTFIPLADLAAAVRALQK
jgi:hypothetical protein